MQHSTHSPNPESPPPDSALNTAPQQPYFQRRRSPVTAEMMEETGGLLELKMHKTGVGDPTRQSPKKGKAKGRTPRNQSDSSTRNWTRQISGRRNFAGVLPPEMLEQIRITANRIESEERIIARMCRNLHASMPQLFSAVAIIAPTLRKLLAEQSILWESVPNRPRRKGACVPLGEPYYIEWASKGSEIVTFVANALKALTPQLAISLEIAIAHIKRTGTAPTPAQLADLTLSQAVADMRTAGRLGEETPQIQHLAASGQSQPIDPPASWMPEPVSASPVLQDLADRQSKRFDAARAKAAAVAQRHDAQQNAAQAQQAPPTPQHSAEQLSHLITLPAPLPANVIPILDAAQLVARAMFISGIDRASVAAPTYAALVAEHAAITRRHAQLSTT